MPAELRVYQADSPSTLIAALDQAYDVDWVDEIDAAGGGGFTIPNDSPVVQANPTILDGDNIVRVRVGATDVFAWLIERKMRTRGDVWDPIQVTGPGVLAMLDQATIYPERGFFDTDLTGDIGVNDERLFGFMSAAYDPDAPGRNWVAPNDIGTASEPYFDSWEPYPEEWPDAHAKWLTPRPLDADDSHPPGDWYIRRVINYTGDAQLVGFRATADDEMMVWFDGDLLLYSQGRFQWQRTFSTNVWLEPGEHVIAAKIHNLAPDRPNNPSAFIFTMSELDANGEPIEMLFRSDDSLGWEVLDYPAEPPGMTPGEILVTAVSEAQTRGAIPHVTLDFDGVNDADAVAWADEIELAVMVADDTVLSIAERLADIGVEVDLDPTLTFRAWQHRGANLTGTVTVGLDEAREVEEEYEDAHTTVVLARSADAWMLSDPDPADRREKFLSLALTPSPQAVGFIADRVRQAFSEGRLWTLFALHEALGPDPYGDYGIGDTILVPGLATVTALDWSLLASRVMVLGGRLTETGEVEWIHEAEPESG